ncbi:MAG: FAD-dependent oxidoreductase [Bacteroidetes bacterium]|nr:FAD-dependent oxidoreductase [Bacteroidota bacterium]MBU1720458.1 FAD-dependent oxidoreductase [Bacteroidota bacterium]
MGKDVLIIGGGIAGMEASAYLSAMGYQVTLVEKANELGGHLLRWERLFPTQRHGKEVLSFLHCGIDGKIRVIKNAEPVAAVTRDDLHIVTLSTGEVITANAVLITTGYKTFDASRKEEYGYGIYNNVVTSADLEEMFSSGKEMLTSSGIVPRRVGFIHCVGSRDEKVGNIYCSKVCCVTAVKQAIELKERLPYAEAFCFYMDLRMYGMHFEELYKEAQEKHGVQFIRGRLSEAAENQDHSLLIKVEDTLTGRPLKMKMDLLVLMVGFEPSDGTQKMAELFHLETGSTRFLKMADEHTSTNVSSVQGVFLAGTCSAPRTITSTITDARAAAAKITSYLSQYSIEQREN